jgi:nitrite reductase/ring-hydroxylating ferredoxin subunit
MTAPGAGRPGRLLCRLADIPDPGSRGFERDGRAIFLVRHGPVIAAYVNSCPHTGGPLDWVEHQFLDLARRHILCATHGALFRLEDGLCLAGPCRGKGLMHVAIEVTAGEVRLASADPPGASDSAENIPDRAPSASPPA